MNHCWMSWKWGGRMNSKLCTYFCEGEDDLKLVNALKLEPSKILQGSSRKLNVVQNLIPKSILLSIKPESNVVLVFDTDVITNLDIVKKNISNIQKYCHDINIIYLLQVQNLEDELTRCTDVKSVLELTKSKSLSNFKTDFKKMKDIECRYALERHKIDVNKLWSFNASRYFNFVIRNQAEVKC